MKKASGSHNRLGACWAVVACGTDGIRGIGNPRGVSGYLGVDDNKKKGLQC